MSGHTPGKPEAQPESLRLAAANENCAKAWVDGSAPNIFRMETACELRRLHAVNTELLDALEAVLRWIDDNCETTGFYPVEAQADAAIAKATGATP